MIEESGNARSWCAPCRRELPNLEKALRFIGKDKLTVLAVSFEERPDSSREIKKLASQWQISMIDDYSGSIVALLVRALPAEFDEEVDRDSPS